MDKKKKICVIALQIVVLGCFVLLAAASGTDGSMTKSSSIIRAGLQGGACGGSGFLYVGTASSDSGCASLCGSNDYSYYCFAGEGSACFCK